MKLEKLHDTAQPWDGYVRQALHALPSELKPVFKSMLEWKPKKKSWGWSIKKTVENVANAQKPLVFGYSDYVLIWMVNKICPDLVITDTTAGKIAFLSSNEEIGALAKYVIENHRQLGSHLYHFILGVALGYPLQSCYDFASQYDPNGIPETQQPEVQGAPVENTTPEG